MNDQTARANEISAKLRPSIMLGPQKAAVLASAVGTETMLGTLLGEARGLTYRANDNDENTPSVGITGPFKFVPADTARPEIWAQVTYLPRSVHDTVITALEGDRVRPVDKAPKRGQGVNVQLPPGTVMRIVLEIGVKRDDSVIGYQYITRGNPKIPLALHDPLAELSAAVAEGKPLAIAAPGAPPVKASAKGKKRK